jgi:sodium/potassium-transporting ATPase subunit alpha
MKIHQLSADEAIASLRSTPQGLLSAEATRRLLEYGPNRVQKVTRESLILRFLKQFTQFFSLILWVAAGLAFLAEWSAPGQGMAKVGYAIIAVILVSGLFSFWQEYRVEQTLAALRKLLPQQVKVSREDKVTQIDVEQLVPGDIVLLEQGDYIPADCRLIEAFGVRVNNATVTGESLPKARDSAASEESELIHSKNILLAGTSMVSGQAKAVVFATGMHTELGKIAHLTQTSGAVVSPLRKEIAHLSRLIATLAVLIGLVFFAIGWAIGVPFWQDFIFSIGIIVAMVPEGLLPTLTLALVLATQRMAKRNVLIRYLPSVETLGATTVICTDKTGTLTQNRMVVKQIFLGGTFVLPVAVTQERQFADHYRPFFLAAQLCQDLKEGEQRGEKVFFGDPMEIALVDMAQQVLPMLPAYRRLDEIPFDADRMRLSTVHEMPDGPTLFCKGAPEAVMPLCNRILVKGEMYPFTPELREKARESQEAMARQGLRVLAFAYRRVEHPGQPPHLEEKLVFTGLAGLEDPPRPEVPEAIRKCREAGIRVIMITGDNPHTARAIAREIGLVQSDNPLVITGEKLRGFSVTQLRLVLDIPEIIFARVGADQKMRIVDALKQKQHVVAVTGDGVNDAPALKSAHIGIAMGITGTDVAKEAADMVLLDDNFASIVNAIEEGRAVFENIRKFLTYILAHNVPELIPYLGFALFAIPLALTPVQILSIDMATDSLTALGLGIERPDPQVMQRPPRSQHKRLFDGSLALRAYLCLGLIEAVASMAAFFFVLNGGGWKYGHNLATYDPLYLQATTACLSAIVVMQIVNVFLCRSNIRSVVSINLLSNRLIVFGVLLEVALILLIDYSYWGNSLLGTAPIDKKVWLFVLPFAVGLLILEEFRKWFVRVWLFNRVAHRKPDASG